jgi:ubiquinone/menaquinone biosynthesis C-methylase UbiE
MPTHDHLVQEQFGAKADAYVTSQVHAWGADLDWIGERARKLGPARALDLGAGGGHVSYRLSAWCEEVVACDLSGEMLEAVAVEASARGLRNIGGVSGAAEALPFATSSFDLVVSRFSAHHWADVERG